LEGKARLSSTDFADERRLKIVDVMQVGIIRGFADECD